MFIKVWIWKLNKYSELKKKQPGKEGQQVIKAKFSTELIKNVVQ